MSGEPYLWLTDRDRERVSWESPVPVPLAVILPDNREVVVLMVYSSTRLLWLDTARRLASALEFYPGMTEVKLESDAITITRPPSSRSTVRLTIEELEPFELGRGLSTELSRALLEAARLQETRSVMED